MTTQYEFLRTALERLEEAAQLPSSQTINQDGTIQQFEFTLEVASKLMTTVVEIERLITTNPRSAIRQAVTIELIDNLREWFNFLDDRILTTRTIKRGIV